MCWGQMTNDPSFPYSRHPPGLVCKTGVKSTSSTCRHTVSYSAVRVIVLSNVGIENTGRTVESRINRELPHVVTVLDCSVCVSTFPGAAHAEESRNRDNFHQLTRAGIVTHENTGSHTGSDFYHHRRERMAVSPYRKLVREFQVRPKKEKKGTFSF